MVVVIGGGRDVFAVITIVRIFIGVVIAQLIVTFTLGFIVLLTQKSAGIHLAGAKFVLGSLHKYSGYNIRKVIE